MVAKMLSVGEFQSHDPKCSAYNRGKGETVTLLLDTAENEDAGLLQLYSEFNAVNTELDRLTSSDVDAPEPTLFALNQRWHDTCRRAIASAARTPAGRRAKAAMLICALDVIAGPSEDRQLHEMLAESLARDLLQ